MSLIKRALSISLIIMILIGVSGCMFTKKNTPEAKKEKVLDYLKKKYGEEFVPVSMIGSGWGQGYDEFRVYPKNGDKEKDWFEVWGNVMDDGTYSMSDGYFGIFIRPQYEAVMSGFVKEIYKDFKLYTSFGQTGVLPDRLNKSTKISEIYNKDEYCSSDTTILVKQASAKGIDTKESLKKIARKMVENKLVGQVRIFIIFDNKFDEMNMDVLKNIPFSEDKNYFLEDYKIIYVDQNLEMDEGRR